MKCNDNDSVLSLTHGILSISENKVKLTNFLAGQIKLLLYS